MSKRKKKGHSPKTQPWWGKTKSAPVVAKLMERKIQGAMDRQNPPEQQWFTMGSPFTNRPIAGFAPKKEACREENNEASRIKSARGFISRRHP